MRKAVAVVVGAIWAIGLTNTSPALAQGTPTPTPTPSLTPTPTPSPTVSTPTPTPAPTSGPGTFLDTSTFRGYLLLLIVIAIIVLVWFIPFMIDLIWSHRTQSASVRGQSGAAAAPGSSASFSRRHLVRALIAFTIVTIVGIALLLVLSGNTLDAEDLRKTLVAAVVAIVGTVVGFYFGGRTAEQAAAAATAAPATGAVVLTPVSANFTEAKTQNVFTLSNNSSAPVTVLSVAVTDSSTGFSVDTSGLPSGSWNGKSTIVAPSGQLSVGVTWAPPATGDGPFISTLAIAHTGTGAPSAQLEGVKNPPAPAAPAGAGAQAESPAPAAPAGAGAEAEPPAPTAPAGAGTEAEPPPPAAE